MATNASFNWLPSTIRVVTVDGFGPLPRGTLNTQPASLVWPPKDPSDVLDFIVDYSEVLAGNVGDAVNKLDVSIAPNAAGDLILTAASADGDQAILWLANGQAGTTYAVNVVVSTNSGRCISRTVSLSVTAFTKTSSSGTVITDQTGAPLADQTGAALTTS